MAFRSPFASGQAMRCMGTRRPVSQCDSMAASFVGCMEWRISAFMWPWAISKIEKTSVQTAAMRNDFRKSSTSRLRERCQAEMPSTKKPASV